MWFYYYLFLYDIIIPWESEVEVEFFKQCQRFGSFRQPLVTGTSVIAIKFNGGVAMAADMLG